MNSTSRYCENCGTVLDPGQRFCGGCGQPTDGSASGALQQPMMSTPVAQASGGKGWEMPVWAWLLMGLVLAGGIGGGLYYVFDSVKPRHPQLTATQEDSIRREVFADLPEQGDAIDLNKATNPTDLPPELQKKFDNSRLSAEHKARMAEALAPMPKIDGELVATAGAPTIVDDFSDPGSGWRVHTDAKAVREYADGRLQVTFTGERGSAQVMSGKKVGNFALQVEATPVSGPPKFWYGVVVRQSEAGKFIVFLVSPQGMYAVSKRENGQNVTLAEPFAARSVRKGNATNVLKVSAVDKYFVFEVNGEMVDVRSIEGFGPGDVGVMVLRNPNDVPDPTKVAFDNYKLWVVR